MAALLPRLLREYIDPPDRPESLPQFFRKLQKKKQTREQQEQAEKAITLYYQIKTPGNSGGIICTKRMYKRRSKRR